MEACYVYRKEMSEEELLQIYKSRIESNPKFSSEVNLNLISITQGFLVYPLIDSSIKNLEYLVLRSKKQQSGVIDVAYHYVSKNFLLNELSTKNFELEDHTIQEYPLFNPKEIEKSEKEFIKYIIEKASKSICKRHNLIITDKANDIDISPIKAFESLEKKYYLEEVYALDYFEKGNRKPWKSLYSPYHNDFYELDFKKSIEYDAYYKLYKHPIVYIPKSYLSFYYDVSFKVYLDTIEELKYLKPAAHLSKLRKNVLYKEYTKYKDYLNQLIFYYRKKEYLKEYTTDCKGLRQQIFYSYLTLKYNPQSGYYLAGLVQNHIIEDNYTKLLDISAKQKNTLAKKALFEYYSEPVSYNSYYLKRYS